jgi:hypothetical protein
VQRSQAPLKKVAFALISCELDCVSVSQCGFAITSQTPKQVGTDAVEKVVIRKFELVDKCESDLRPVAFGHCYCAVECNDARR